MSSVRADARAAAYRLFARLFRREVTPDLVPLLRGIPELGDALAEPFDDEEAAVEHHRVFALQVPPFAGVFVDPEGRIGGEPAALVRDLYARAGLEVDERSEEADHVVHTLELLAEVGDRPALAAEALDRSVLPWLPWLVEALGRHAGPFHRTLGELALELALEHRGSLDRPVAAPLDPSQNTTLEDPLADPAAGLSRIATYLVTPARGGLYLARDDIRRLAAGTGLPVGFGSRSDSLETLLRAGAELGGFDAVVDGLESLVASGARACDALEGSGVPGTAGPAALRRARLERTADVLRRLREGAATGA